jgi:putative ATP-dependent endonuclease of the OLD family
LTNTGDVETASTVLSKSVDISEGETADLERYLDATRSSLLFARKVMLVEGPAEQFLIPPLISQILNIDLDRLGISIIPIYGVHFDIYAKMFGDNAIRKKCAIIADGDLKPSDASESVEGEEKYYKEPDLDKLVSKYVKVFRCRTTFERAITTSGTLLMLAATAKDIGAPRIARALEDGLDKIKDTSIKRADKIIIMSELREKVLNTAKRCGKARFAQAASKYVTLAESLPVYIEEAVTWLTEDEIN